MRTCNTCKTTKPINQFKKSNNKSGYNYKCNDCVFEYYRNYRNKNKERIKANNQKWLKSEKGKKVMAGHRVGLRRKFPEKATTWSFWSAFKIKHGIIVPKGYEFHHYSYHKEDYADVIFLPSWLHRIIHHQMRYNQEQKYYETLDGELLDTKEKHMLYIQKIIHIRNSKRIAA